MPRSDDSASPPTAQPHLRKARAAAFALLLGWTGQHRRYLRASLWWVYPMIALPAIGWALRAEPWFRQPGFFVAAALVVVTMIEAIVIALTSDERWDQRYNPHSGHRSSNGWAPVIVAIFGLIFAAMLGMTTMALALEDFFLAQRP